MKKSIYFAVVLAIGLSACVSENFDQSSKSEPVIFSGSYGAQPETRTTLGNTTLERVPVYWSVGDKIGAFALTTGTGATNAQAVLTSGEGTRTGKFAALDGVVMNPSENRFCLYYPYDATAHTAGSSTSPSPVKCITDVNPPYIIAFLPATQIQQAAGDYSHFAKYGYSVAISERAAAGEVVNFTMQHILSYLELSIYASGDLTGYAVEEITMTTPAGKNISGPFKGNFDGTYLQGTSSDPTAFSNSIELSVAASQPLPGSTTVAHKFLLSFLPVDVTGQKVNLVAKVSKGTGAGKQYRYYTSEFSGIDFKSDQLTRKSIDLGSWARIYPFRAAVIWEEGTTKNTTITWSSVQLVSGATGGTDLSAKQANVYVINTSGSYVIPAKLADGTWIDGIEPGNADHITFTIPSGASGNALIGVYRWNPADPTNPDMNKMLYSWHLWMANPQEVTISGTTFLDLSLGATSKVEGDKNALPYYYQWGRKDPFIRANAIDGGNGPQDGTAFTFNTKPAVMNSEIFGNGLIWGLVRSKQSYNDTYERPTLFVDGEILGETGIAWNFYLTEGHRNIPSYNNGSVTTWAEHANPCPAGYRVPTVAELQKLTGASYSTTNKGSMIQGMWFPYAGYRNNERGNLTAFGTSLLLWSNTTNTAGGETGKYATSWNGLSLNDGRISGGRQVRCVKN